MKNPERKESTVITSEVVSPQASSQLSGETYHKSRGSGIGGKAGLAIGSMAICGLGFVAGMQMNNLHHRGGVHGQAGGPPGMSRYQDNQHLGRAQAGGDQKDGGALNSNQSQPDARQQAPSGPNHGSEPRGKSQQGEKLQGQQPPQPRQGNGQRHPDNAQPQPVNKQ